MTDKHNELETLWFDWESGLATESQVAELQRLLESDEQARHKFLELQMLSSALQWQGSEEPSHGDLATTQPALSTPAKAREAKPSMRMAAWSFVAGITVCCGFVAAFVLTQPDEGPVEYGAIAEQTEATSRGIAVLTETANADWGDGIDFEPGQALPAGKITLKSGAAQIEFLCGATVIVEGPAELNLISAREARVIEGRLRANVPPAARGFLLRVDELEVVDLGTEFGLSVDKAGTQVDVFDGEVELHKANTIQLVTAGKSIVHGVDGTLKWADEGQSFLDFNELQQRAETAHSEKRLRSQNFLEQLKQDARLLAFYSFDRRSIDGQRLQSEAIPVNPELDGAIVGTQPAYGRWSDHHALEFKQPADRVRVQIPGHQTALTLSAWVKIDSLDRQYNSLFLTDGYDKGEPHWQILETGELYFSVRPTERGEDGPADFKVLSDPFFNPSLQGKWIHLAVCCDLESGFVTHYLNGKSLSRQQVPAEQRPENIRIGRASIGNWAAPTLPEDGFAIRNLNGCIDEFAIFTDALSAEEVQEIFEYGKP